VTEAQKDHLRSFLHYDETTQMKAHVDHTDAWKAIRIYLRVIATSQGVKSDIQDLIRTIESASAEMAIARLKADLTTWIDVNGIS